MSDKLTKAQAEDLYSYVDELDYEPFELMPARGDQPAKVVQFRGATAGEYFQGIVKRFPVVEAEYVDGIKLGVSQAKAAAEKEAREIAAGRGKIGYRPPADPVAPESGLMQFDLVAFAEREIAHGVEVKAALIAICVDRAGDRAFEAHIVKHPRFAAFAGACDRKTKGARPLDFSGAVTEIFLGEMGPVSPDDEPTETTSASTETSSSQS
ncbi:hypothetical protein AU375_02325 [Methylobacterium radiotolerans]|nr:hypothetical protein AU375_02325 [Methylobacterium radiotolerans]